MAVEQNVGLGENAMEPFEKDIIRDSSIPLPGRCDTYIHPFGHEPTDFTIATRIPSDKGVGVDIHDNPLDPHNHNTNNY